MCKWKDIESMPKLCESIPYPKISMIFNEMVRIFYLCINAKISDDIHDFHNRMILYSRINIVIGSLTNRLLFGFIKTINNA